MEPILTIKNLSAAYDGKPALEDLSMEIPKHRITAVIGPSGCGKSTLLRAMNGLLREESGASVSGSVRLDGQDISAMPADEVRRRIGLVFQTPAPFPFSIYKNMTYAPRYYGLRNKQALDQLVTEKLKMAGLYEEVKDELGKSALKLSGGQQQRLCIARALTVEPEVLLLDEPCSALDVKASAVIEQMLLELKEHYTIVIVTHNIAQARRISDHVAFLYGGQLVEFGESDRFFAAPQQEETRAFLEGAIG
jgi:phosphate transport system ATP-binding protein